MDFESYASRAVDLVNTPLTSLDDLRTVLTGYPWRLDRLRASDLPAMRALQQKLREVFNACQDVTDGTDPAADLPVDALNSLLADYPAHPHISGHTNRDWHIHVTGPAASVASNYGAETAWGLAIAFTRWGPQRFGCCAAAGCERVFLDTSSNGLRRFCSEACASRTHVAAHRARRRQIAGAAG